MNYAFARNQYKRSTQAGLTGLSDPHEMISLTLQELSRCLATLQLENLDPEKRKTSVSKAFTAVYILQTSLDFEKGGDIAKNLFTVYEYCRAQLQKAMKFDETAKIDACAYVINDIIDAWTEIK